MYLVGASMCSFVYPVSVTLSYDGRFTVHLRTRVWVQTLLYYKCTRRSVDPSEFLQSHYALLLVVMVIISIIVAPITVVHTMP